MEMPHIGVHCSVTECQQLDFLPIKCSICHKLFCKNHYKASDNRQYVGPSGHFCPNANQHDNIVPECPLCSALIPIAKGANIDEVVGRHIDNQCRSKPALSLKGKIFKNHCNFKNCKKRELMPILCQQCGLNFCLTHRHESDHQCQGRNRSALAASGTPFNGLSRSAMAAIRRALSYEDGESNKNSQQVTPTAFAAATPVPSQVSTTPHVSNNLINAQRGLSDEEALAIALSESSVASQSNPTNMSESERQRVELLDAELAAALQQQEQNELRNRQRATTAVPTSSSEDKNCSVQ